MKLKCLSGKHGDGSGWYENEPLGFKVERELHFFNLAVAQHHRIELYSTDSPALSFKTQMLRASTANLLRVCGRKLNICRRQLQEGFQKLPKLQIYTSLPCACKGSVWTQAIQILTSAVCYILRLRCNEDFLNVKLLSLSPPLFSSYVSEIPNFPPKWRPRVGRMSRDYRPYPWPPNHGTELPFSSGLGRWDLTLS